MRLSRLLFTGVWFPVSLLTSGVGAEEVSQAPRAQLLAKHLRHGRSQHRRLHHGHRHRLNYGEAELPRPHPLVSRALKAMGKEVTALHSEEEALQHDRQAMQDLAEQASKEAGSGANLRRLVSAEAAHIRDEDKRLKHLEAQAERLHLEHDDIEARLQELMRPRVRSTQRRLERQRGTLAKSETEVARWNRLREKYQASAMQLLTERKKSLEDLKKAQEEVVQAQKKEVAAEKEYQVEKDKVAREVEALKYARAKYEAAKSEEHKEEEETHVDESSLARTFAIYKVEERRIEAATSANAQKLQRKIAHMKAEREASQKRLAEAKKRFADWQAAQKQRVEQVQQVKKQYEEHEQAHIQNRDKVMATATSRAGASAASGSDWAWDDWAWSGSDDSVA